MAKKKTLNQDFFKVWTPEMAYVLGFFAADGNMICNKRGACFISFHITDKNLLRHIKWVMGSNHKLAVRDRGNERHKIGYRLQIGSKVLFEDLLRLGMTPRKSATLRLPKIAPQFQCDFVRGYFDGDGCVYFARLKFAKRKRPRYALMSLFTSGSRMYLQDLHVLLKQHGVQGGVIKQKERGFELVLSHKDSIALFAFIYNNVATTRLYLPRKYSVFAKAVKVLGKVRP